MWTGAVSGPSPLLLKCAANETISRVKFAWFQRLTASSHAPEGPQGWHCYGQQPPPKGTCQSDVSSKVADFCVGKSTCDLSDKNTVAALGEPCQQSQGHLQLIVRVECTAHGDSKPSTNTVGAMRMGACANNLSPGHLSPGQVWVTVNVTVPGASTGEVHVPIQGATSGTITESGAVVWSKGKGVPGAVDGVKVIGNDGRFAIFRTGSGNYSFHSLCAAQDN